MPARIVPQNYRTLTGLVYNSRTSTMTATDVIGPYAQIAEGSAWAPDHGQWEFYELLARGSGIRAGTTEILKNILGERVLGLPKD